MLNLLQTKIPNTVSCEVGISVKFSTMCLFSLLSCLCRNTLGRACKRRKRVGYSERTFGRAIVDQLALVRRAPGPAYVPR
ncbi:hypothetical protein PHET_05840 [Paragonimus heterotremus]|uniref:Uncharacterized protein n=1 Tax=Paragonimus heterotremus TaxID=100268 RepID=A0A8J4TKE1_9TREM|nr:hypothetical protein PHET_05840 [Paragonimus heterotremus]